MLAVRDLTVRFPGVLALDAVSLEFVPGTAHAVVGENGAGKSTLMRVLAGIQAPTSGVVLLDQQPTHWRGVRQAQDAGVAMIHQELNLVDELSAADNIFLGDERTRRGRLDRAAMRAEADALLSDLGAEFPASAPVGRLRLAGKQLVEIAKAVRRQARFVIMDEPTAVLSERETDALFTLIGRLTQRGVGVLYISHMLHEVLAVCQTASVLRDGRHVGTIPCSGATPASLASMMVGRELAEVFPERCRPSDRLVLEAENVTAQGVSNCSIRLRQGEILGLAGLVGSGRTEFAEALAGLRPRHGEVRVEGKLLTPGHVRTAVQRGLAYLGEERKVTGLIMDQSVRYNTTLAHLKAYARVTVDRPRERTRTQYWSDRLGIRAPSLETPVRNLSGGNQQKVVLAKWLETEPRVLTLDEPTRGVDVGAKSEIYHILTGLAREGVGILLVSSELPELLGLCTRIAVMRSGRVVGELEGQAMTEENVMRLAAGVQAA